MFPFLNWFRPKKSPHIPVLLDEVIKVLRPKEGEILVDGTAGFGGHGEALCEKIGKKGTYIGFDKDPEAIQFTKRRLSKYAPHLIHSSYQHAKRKLADLDIKKVNLVLLDLGMSSYQLDGSNRGFKFMENQPLDMRMNPTRDILTAKEILATYSGEKLSDMFYYLGELKHNKKLVDKILYARKTNPISTTEDLVKLIRKSFFFGGNKRHLFFKTASQVFQALRIEVNHELIDLQAFLDQLPDLLAPKARVAFISFHSLEDRMIKYYFKERENQFTPLTKKAIAPSQAEKDGNSRSRSAKLRAYIFDMGASKHQRNSNKSNKHRGKGGPKPVSDNKKRKQQRWKKKESNG